MITMNDLRDVCLGLPEANESFPFGDEAAVYKVSGKIFALISQDAPDISLKCDPAFGEVLRMNYEAVKPGYHLDKRHWITVNVDGSVPDDEVIEWIDTSYRLVIAKMPKAERERLLRQLDAG